MRFYKDRMWAENNKLRCTLDAADKIVPPREVEASKIVLPIEVVDRDTLNRCEDEIQRFKCINEDLNNKIKSNKNILQDKETEIQKLSTVLTKKEIRILLLESKLNSAIATPTFDPSNINDYTPTIDGSLTDTKVNLDVVRERVRLKEEGKIIPNVILSGESG